MLHCYRYKSGFHRNLLAQLSSVYLTLLDRSLTESLFHLLVAKNVKAFASSDSLAKVQEVASWLLEMNQELLSVGSKRRRTGGSLRGNASSSQVDEEQMNRVVEEEEQQQRRQQEVQHIGRNGEIGGEDPGFDDTYESQQEQLEENNNRLITVDEDSTCNQEENDDEHAGDQEEEMEEEEEMDQDSDDFDQSDDSSREDEHANCNSVTNSNSLMDLPIHQSSPFYMKTKIPFWRKALLTLQGRSTSCLTDRSSLPAPWWFNSCLY
uniref:F-box and WD repeat domain containing 7 n=2 Tax=Ficedula albicollis TaxID=59894 RepID=A0A803VK57_FICAL